MGTHTRHEQREAGFTYVEMTIIVCLIGLLAAAMIVATHAVSNRARNARIVSSMQQMKVIAEEVYEQNNNAGYCVAGGPCANTDPRMDVFKRDIDEMNVDDGGEPTLYAAASFCAEAVMRGGDTYCTDSDGTVTGNWANSGVGTCNTTAEPSAPFCE